ncbi:MAG: phosphatidate cytidylyltransferase [Chloroflexi bacterium]|nr:phosphatidate cytidylyltransferase [Chloroflexota bacterium]MCY4248702.1 phosphatidate cytidylyltransferase [Chloroflexota bacterium]
MSKELVTNSAESTNLRDRIITASVLVPVAVSASLAGGWLFLCLALPLMCLGMLEFFVMEKDTRMQGSSLTGIPTAVVIVLGFYLGSDWLWQAALGTGIALTLALETARHPQQPGRALAQAAMTLCGILYLAFPTAFLVSLRNRPEDGLIWLFVVYAITWGTDTFAYVFGRVFGRTQLAPLISPNKTVEGAVGGILCAWALAFFILLAAGRLEPRLALMILVGPILAVCGDLFESGLKRFFRVKDSYVVGFNVFPGHGGVLDRIDALVWVASWVFFYLMSSGMA